MYNAPANPVTRGELALSTVQGLLATRAFTLESNISLQRVLPPAVVTSNTFQASRDASLWMCRKGDTRRAQGAKPTQIATDSGDNVTFTLDEWTGTSSLDIKKDAAILNGNRQAAEDLKAFAAVAAVLNDMEFVGAAALTAASINTTNLSNGFANASVDPVEVIVAGLNRLRAKGVQRAFVSAIMHPDLLTLIFSNAAYLSKYSGVGVPNVVNPATQTQVLANILGIRDVRLTSNVTTVSDIDTASPTFVDTWAVGTLTLTVINDDPNDLVSPQLGKTVFRPVIEEGARYDLTLPAFAQMFTVEYALRDFKFVDYNATANALIMLHPAAANVSERITNANAA